MKKVEEGDTLIARIEGISTLDKGLPDEDQHIDITEFLPLEIPPQSSNDELKSAATSGLLLSTVARIFAKGSLAELWGAINGM